MDKQEQIEEIAKVMCLFCKEMTEEKECERGKECFDWRLKEAQLYYEKGVRKVPDGAVILTKEEYEKLKSLYDCQHGSIMTSSIGDLPLTIGGLRKAVDEISRLINVQTELQVLNAKYYNEAKHLRRELKQARKETAKEILLLLGKGYDETKKTEFNNLQWYKEFCRELKHRYGVEVEE